MIDSVKEVQPVRSKLKDILVASVGIISVIYLLNPTFGVFELIPDQIPLIGNIDEAFATFLLINVLLYFGVDIRWFLYRWWWKK